MTTALMNVPAECLRDCALTFRDRQPIDIDLAIQQHADYASALRQMGVYVEILRINDMSPDGVFVEDAAIVLDECAIVASMGIEARRAEVDAMADVLSRFRSDLRRIHWPARIEGGDVLVVGKRIYVGQSSRTNAAGLLAVKEIAAPLGYDVRSVTVRGCLHLKTGVTAIDETTLICNPEWIDVSAFYDVDLMHVDPHEPWAANILRVDDQLLLNGSFPRTADRIDAIRGGNHRIVVSEFAKAEAGLTCLSIVFNSG